MLTALFTVVNIRVKGTVNKQMYTTGGYLMLKTVRGAVKINY
jgi:hypothetical protein